MYVCMYVRTYVCIYAWMYIHVYYASVRQLQGQQYQVSPLHLRGGGVIVVSISEVIFPNGSWKRVLPAFKRCVVHTRAVSCVWNGAKTNQDSYLMDLFLCMYLPPTQDNVNPFPCRTQLLTNVNNKKKSELKTFSVDFVMCIGDNRSMTNRFC